MLKWQVAGLVVLAVAASAAVGAAVLRPEGTPPVPAEVSAAYENKTTAPVAAVADKTLITVIGDSYVGGSNMGGNGINNWTALITADLPNPKNIDLNKAGLGGSGYVTRGPTGKVFEEAAAAALGPNTDVVVFFGSINDGSASGAKVGSAAAQTFATAKEAAPKAKLLVFGPAWTNENVPAEMLAVRDAVKRSAQAAGATWVDPIGERWFFDRTALIGADKTHPTDEGHAYMEKQILPHLKKVLATL